jgi:hypothetical protein
MIEQIKEVCNSIGIHMAKIDELELLKKIKLIICIIKNLISSRILLMNLKIMCYQQRITQRL